MANTKEDEVAEVINLAERRPNVDVVAKLARSILENLGENTERPLRTLMAMKLAENALVNLYAELLSEEEHAELLKRRDEDIKAYCVEYATVGGSDE